MPSSFAESQLPSSGKLTKKQDRKIIKEIEKKLSHAYVLFAILSQCTLVRLVAEGNEDTELSFTLRGKQVRAEDTKTLHENLTRMPFLPRLVVLDLSRNLISGSDRGDLEDCLRM